MKAAAIAKMPMWLRDIVVQSGYVGGKVDSALSPVSSLAGSAKAFRSLLPSRSTTERTTTDTRGHGTSSFEERFTGGY